MEEFILGIIVIASLVFGYFAARRLGRFLEENERNTYRAQTPLGNSGASRQGKMPGETGAVWEPLRTQPATGHGGQSFR